MLQCELSKPFVNCVAMFRQVTYVKRFDDYLRDLRFFLDKVRETRMEGRIITSTYLGCSLVNDNPHLANQLNESNRLHLFLEKKYI